ncbi:MAG TPA: efflux RND transporter periplasmic adaptor subunit, partial [Bdellovibrionota bacterium]|nr:efflux RND transporter periplasmic adaptor subunit [Bdellovibrionota bacterium]
AGVVRRSDLLQRVTVVGTVVPKRRTVITAPYNGYVRKLFVKVGDQVKQGDPVVSISQSLAATDPVYPIRAPFSGTVVQVEKGEGEFVKEGETNDFVLRIDDLSSLFVTADVAEIDRTKVAAGREATMRAASVLSRTYKGLVKDVALAARDNAQKESSQVVFGMRIEILDPDADLRPGISMVVDILAEEKRDVLTLRHEFVLREKGKHFIFLADSSKRPIEVGTQNDEEVEVLSGVAEGARVRQVDYTRIGGSE